jgi:hypothetical protein
MLNLFIADVKEEFHPAFIASEIKGTFGGNVKAYVDNLYEKSIFANEQTFMDFMKNYDKNKDP